MVRVLRDRNAGNSLEVRLWDVNLAPGRYLFIQMSMRHLYSKYMESVAVE